MLCTVFEALAIFSLYASHVGTVFPTLVASLVLAYRVVFFQLNSVALFFKTASW